jgi:hypothetical protein
MSGIHLALLGMSFGAAIPDIGAAYEGGFFAGQISTAGNGVADYNLVIAPRSSGQNGSIKYSNDVYANTPGASSVIDGPTNSANLNNPANPAAFFCEGLTIGGFSDWYMPAKNELEVCYFNLKPTTASNSTSSGTNTNAVPSRGSNYTAGNPAQTAATDFQTGNTEDFNGVIYYSSTQTGGPSIFTAAATIFSDGTQANDTKDNDRNVRAVRRVAV